MSSNPLILNVKYLNCLKVVGGKWIRWNYWVINKYGCLPRCFWLAFSSWH